MRCVACEKYEDMYVTRDSSTRTLRSTHASKRDDIVTGDRGARRRAPRGRESGNRNS